MTQWAGTAVLTTQRVQVVTPNGSPNRLRVTITTADAALAAGDYAYIGQNIEGVRIADFRYGAASARQAVLRFGFKAPAGTYSVAVRNSAGDRSYVTNFTISAGQANTDTEQTIVIPGDTTGTWLTDNGIGCAVRIGLAAGTTFQGVAGWQAGNLFCTAANSNGIGTAAAVFELFDVGLYLDPQATGTPPQWEMPDEAEELAACFRYFVDTRTFNASNNVIGIGLTYSATLADALFEYPVQMRVIPVIAFSGAWNATGAGGGTVAATPGTPTPQNQRYAFCRVTASGLISGGTTWVYTTNSAARCQANARM